LINSIDHPTLKSRATRRARGAPDVARAAATETASDTGERILGAALEAFSEKGFDGATTRDIAARAGATLGLLQYHFGGKLGLWRAAVDRAFAELRTGLRVVLENPEPVDDRERLRLLIRGHVHFVARSPAFVRIMHDEGKRRGPRMRWLVDRHVKPLYEAMMPLILRSQEAGILPSDIAPFHFLYILAGSVGVIFHQAEECKRLAGVDPTDEAVVDAHARAVEYFFLGHEKTESSR
jgi:AcrR family transcriptional regulator